MIKIYINNFNLNDFSNKINNINTVAKSCIRTIKHYIYSKEGFFIINYNSICKIERIDCECEKILLNNKNIIIDKSYDNIIKNIYQIPIDHKICKQITYQYKINNKSRLSFIIETLLDKNFINEEKVINYYFTVGNSVNINEVEEEIDTFLSILN